MTVHILQRFSPPNPCTHSIPSVPNLLAHPVLKNNFIENGYFFSLLQYMQQYSESKVEKNSLSFSQFSDTQKSPVERLLLRRHSGLRTRTKRGRLLGAAARSFPVFYPTVRRRGACRDFVCRKAKKKKKYNSLFSLFCSPVRGAANAASARSRAARLARRPSTLVASVFQLQKLQYRQTISQ